MTDVAWADEEWETQRGGEVTDDRSLACCTRVFAV